MHTTNTLCDNALSGIGHQWKPGACMGWYIACHEPTGIFWCTVKNIWGCMHHGDTAHTIKNNHWFGNLNTARVPRWRISNRYLALISRNPMSTISSDDISTKTRDLFRYALISNKQLTVHSGSIKTERLVQKKTSSHSAILHHHWHLDMSSWSHHW